MKTHAERVNFLWGIAELLRDHFKRGKYQDVILPLTVLRRIDCVLEPTKEAVLKRDAELKDLGLENRDAQLRTTAGYARSRAGWTASRARRLVPAIPPIRPYDRVPHHRRQEPAAVSGGRAHRGRRGRADDGWRDRGQPGPNHLGSTDAQRAGRGRAGRRDSCGRPPGTRPSPRPRCPNAPRRSSLT